MKRALRGTPVWSAVAVCCFLSVAAARAADDPASWAPKDALLYFGITDCSALSASMKRTLAWRSLEDPATQKVTEPFKKLAKKLQEYAAGKLSLESPQELEVYPQGPLAFFVTLTTQADDGPLEVVTAVMDMGDQIDKVKSLCDKVVRACQDRGGRKETEEIGGAQITSIRFASDPDDADIDSAIDDRSDEIDSLLDDIDLDPASMAVLQGIFWELEPPETFAFAFAGNRWIVSSEAVGVKQAVRQIRGGGDDSFAATAAMRTLSRRCGGDAPIRMVINLPRLIDLSAREDEETAKEMRALGMSGLGPLVATLDPAPTPDVEMRIRGYMEIEQDATGVAKILRLPNGRTAPPASISADAALFGMLQLDLRAIVAEVMDIVTRIDSRQGESMRAAMKVPQPDGSVLDVQKDVLEHFSGPFFGMMTLSAPYGVDECNAMLAMGHKSREGCQKLVAMIPPGFLVPREMMGATIYDVPMLPVPGLAAGVTDRTLILAGTKNAVEGYVRTEGQTDGGLAADPNYRRVAAHLPPESCAHLYVTGRKYFDAQLAIHKSGDLSKDQPPQFGLPVGAFLRWSVYNAFTAEGMENPEAMRKYVTLFGFTLTSESDGLRFEGVSLPAGEMN